MQTRKILVTAGALLIEYKAKSYKGTVEEFVAEVNQLNGVANYITKWVPGEELLIPLVKGAK